MTSRRQNHTRKNRLKPQALFRKSSEKKKAAKDQNVNYGTDWYQQTKDNQKRFKSVREVRLQTGLPSTVSDTHRSQHHPPPSPFLHTSTTPTQQELEWRRQANIEANNGKERKDLYTDNWDGDVYKGSKFNVLTVILLASVVAPLAGLIFAYQTYGILWG
jgi:hypothetical protein